MSKTSGREKYFMEVAKLTSSLSTCKSTSVGAVAVKGNHIVATGYNGVPSGMKHCNEVQPEDHQDFANRYEIHAEMNVLMDALDRGQQLTGCVVYTTHSPCWNCLKHLKRAGISGVVYNERYWRISDSEYEEMLRDVCQQNMFMTKLEN